MLSIHETGRLVSSSVQYTDYADLLALLLLYTRQADLLALLLNIRSMQTC